MITFAEAKKSRILRIAGACPDSPDFAQLLNDGVRLLMKRGNWTTTVQFTNTCVWGNVITWNRYVGTVLGLDVCGHTTIPLNYWHEWVYPGDMEASRRWGHWQRHGCGNIHTVALGNSPVFNQIADQQASFVQFYPTTQVDQGKTITLFGLDQNNQAVITKRPDGTLQQGEVLTLKLPFVMSTIPYRRIDRVIKDPTQGRVSGFFFDTVKNVWVPMATYEPGETAPMYVTSRIPNIQRWNGSPQIVSAMVKTEVVEVVSDTDLVQIDNLDALAYAMQSAKHSDAYDHAGAEAALVRAIRDLNYQLRDKYPLEQTTVSFRPFGTASLQKLFLGMR